MATNKNDERSSVERELDKDVIGTIHEVDGKTTDLTERLMEDAARPSVQPSMDDAAKIDASNSLFDALMQTWLRENKAGRIEFQSHEYTAVTDNDEVFFIRAPYNAIGQARYDSTAVRFNR